jgi:acetyl esterase/lipase
LAEHDSCCLLLAHNLSSPGERDYAREAAAHYRHLQTSNQLNIDQAETLQTVFLGWFLERFRDRSHKEIAMILDLPDIEDTRAGRELLEKGLEKGLEFLTTRTFLASILVASVSFTCVASAADPITLELWPEGVPEKSDFVPQPEQETIKDDGLRRLSHVSQPTLTVCRPAHPERSNGTSVLICPGGGYQGLAIEHEGTQVADYLNTLGITGIVLKYRVPRRDPEKPHEAPLADALQAMKLIRTRAVEWGIKPDRVGILGFSAGGHLCVMTALHAQPEERPNFMVLVYPAYLTLEKDDYTLRPEIKVTASTPPACFVHAGDDRIPAMGSVLLYQEYKKLGIPAELHIYSQGGHGFGMKPNGAPVNQWHVRVAEWLGANGWLVEQ